jgi:hypothetical protein
MASLMLTELNPIRLWTTADVAAWLQGHNFDADIIQKIIGEAD